MVIGGLDDARAAAAGAAAALGYRDVVVDAPVVGDASRAADDIAERLRAASAGGVPVCVVSGGETTVTVRGTGRGGRNQELALALAPWLGELGGVVGGLCAGTDGIDGPTDAAGAYVDGTTMARASMLGLDHAAHLKDNNSHEFFARLGDLVRTGPTGANVGDIQIFLWRPDGPPLC